jgi:hypothetical protein
MEFPSNVEFIGKDAFDKECIPILLEGYEYLTGMVTWASLPPEKMSSGFEERELNFYMHPDYVQEGLVWIPTKGGQKYHTYAGCSNMDGPEQVTKSYAETLGFTPCKRCH